MGENKENKKLSTSTKYIIIGIVIGIIIAIVGIVVWTCSDTNDTNEEKFNNNLKIFEENTNENNYQSDDVTFSVTGSWDNKEIKIIGKMPNLDYENASDEEKENLFYNIITKEYCDDIMNPIIESMNEHGWKEDNISYSLTIIDKNNKEIIRYNY